MLWKNVQETPQTLEREQALQKLEIQMKRTENFIQAMRDSARIGHLSAEKVEELAREFGSLSNSIYESLTQKRKEDNKDSPETTR